MGSMTSQSAIQTFATAGVSSLALPEAHDKANAGRRMYELKVVAGAAVAGALVGGTMVAMLGLFTHGDASGPRRPAAVVAEVAAPDQILALSAYSRDPASSSMDVALARRFPAVTGTIEEIVALRPAVVVSGNFTPPAMRAAPS